MTTTIGIAMGVATMNAGPQLANGGTLQVRNGSTVIATVTLGATTFGANAAEEAPYVANAAVIAQIPTLTSNAVVTPDNYRVLDSGSGFLSDGTVGASGSGADMELSDASLVNGQEFTITSWKYRILAAG